MEFAGSHLEKTGLAGLITEDGVLNLERHFKDSAGPYDALTDGL
jgi:hypothetical protein